jgi:hypothetical protein
MANIGRKAATAATFVVVVSVAGPASCIEAARAPTVNPGAGTAIRVRSDHPAIKRMIADGERRSPTFRSLMVMIETTDGIIYVEHGRCGRGVRACLVMAVTIAGPYRLLRVRLDSRKSGEDAIAALGHELRHAVEILSEPNITSGAAMYLFYKRFGTWLGEASFETAAAVAAGDAIRRELPRTRRDDQTKAK